MICMGSGVNIMHLLVPHEKYEDEEDGTDEEDEKDDKMTTI